MKQHFLLLSTCAATLTAGAGADPLCEAVRSELERHAQARGLEVQVQCRLVASPIVPAGAVLQALPWQAEQRPRSGAMTWPVRITAPAARPYLRQVPLTASWTAPAWVAQRTLQSDAQLHPGDLALQTRRWPDGWTVEPGEAAHPPTGRLRQSLRAGDLLPPMALLPEDMLQRGDRVTAVLAEGAVEIRLPAQLLAPARVGERARAQPNGRSVAMEGRLMDSHILKVDSE